MDKKQKPQNETGQKKIYTPPRLVTYGAVRSLTQAGSSNGKENAQGGSKNRP